MFLSMIVAWGQNCNYFALFLGCPIGWDIVLMLILRFVIYCISFASFFCFIHFSVGYICVFLY